MIEAVQLRLMGYENRPAGGSAACERQSLRNLRYGGRYGAAALLARAGRRGIALPQGTVRVGGFDTAALSRKRSGFVVGFCCFGERNIMTRMTVWGLMQFRCRVCAARAAPGRRAGYHTRFSDSLDTGRPAQYRRLGRLGPDERRRAGVAQALVGNPGYGVSGPARPRGLRTGRGRRRCARTSAQIAGGRQNGVPCNRPLQPSCGTALQPLPVHATGKGFQPATGKRRTNRAERATPARALFLKL